MKPSTYLKNLQEASNWRAQYHPLRGLTMPRLVALLEAGERGDYARLQWLYRFVEKRNATLRAVLQRRLAALAELDWDIRVRSGLDSNRARALAARQAAALREAYERLENLREAVSFLALAEFRGYAHLERHADERGRTVRLAPVPQWFWSRSGPDAPWRYNAAARPGPPRPEDPALDPERFVYREVAAPVDEVAALAHLRQGLSQKDWDGFIETYGLPPLFVELPPDVPPEREAEYQAQAEAIIGDARGTVPHGTRVHTVDSGARGTNPFAEHLRYQDELIVLAATGGKLTVLTESGSGTLAGGAQAGLSGTVLVPEAEVAAANAPGPVFDPVEIAVRFRENVPVAAVSALEAAETALALLHLYRPATVNEVFTAAPQALRRVPDPDGVMYEIRVRTQAAASYAVPRLEAPTIASTGTVSPQTVTLAHPTAGAALFYTLDGSMPAPRGTGSVFYSGPFAVGAPGLLRARAWLAGYLASPEAKARFA